MSEQTERLKELFKHFGEPRTLTYRGEAIPLYVPKELLQAPTVELDVSPALRALHERVMGEKQEIDRKQLIHKKVRTEMLDGSKMDVTSLEALIRRKADFIEKYGGGYEYPQAPFTMRLVYNGLCQRDFTAANSTELVFSLFDCCQELLDDYAIKEEPESIEMQVYRTPWRHPKAESRVHSRERDPGRGQWIPIMTFKVQEVTPFFSFEELELAHEELWRMVPEYARRKINPCGEIPLVEQKLGTFLTMQ